METTMSDITTTEYADEKPVMPKGLRITAVATIAQCGIQIVGFLIILWVAAAKMGITFGEYVIYSTALLGSLLPLFGIVAGTGLLLKKSWGRKSSLVFSVIAIFLYGTAFALMLIQDPNFEGKLHYFILPAIGLMGIPVWNLYYLNKKNIKKLLAH